MGIFVTSDVRKVQYCFRLKAIIDSVMPAVEEKFKNECQRIAEEKYVLRYFYLLKLNLL